MRPEELTVNVLPIEGLDSISHDWDLVAVRAGGRPVQDHVFFRTAIRGFGWKRGVVLVVSQSGRPVAAGIFGRNGFSSWATYQPSQAPIGAWVAEPGVDPSRLTDAVFRALPGFALRVSLTQQDPCLFRCPEDPTRFERSTYIETGGIRIHGSFEAYWRGCSGNLRENMKKQLNRLERAGRTAELIDLRGPDDVVRGVEEYGLLESAGWKAREGTAVHPENAQGIFYQSLLSHYARSGEASVFQFRIDGELVASDLCLLRNGILYVLKTTYREGAEKLSPALLMRMQIMKWLFESGQFQSVEFYGRVMEWHRRFGSDIREIYHLDCYRSGSLLPAAALVRRAKRLARLAHRGGQ